jgi:DNA polymerase (family 10)
MERIRLQMEQINDVNRSGAGATLLCGIEADILADGTLDVPDRLLAQLDFAVASVHSNLRMARNEMTERVLRAVRNPHVTILGHPTGRLLLERPPIEIDMEKVLETCAACATAVELNAHPQRLDLDYTWGPAARNLDLKVPIDPDTHHRPGLSHARTYGVAIARKAWLEPRHVLNCLSLGALRAKGLIRPATGS